MRRPCNLRSGDESLYLDSKSALDMMHDAPAVGQHCPVTALLRHSVNSQFQPNFAKGLATGLYIIAKLLTCMMSVFSELGDSESYSTVVVQ
jgi:hypothetical protein